MRNLSAAPDAGARPIQTPHAVWHRNRLSHLIHKPALTIAQILCPFPW